ncbi:MAG TPA: xanthine dehydrogenase family protein molybdopterin-binding subunit, partial [Thermodesulfobacteriota bacterium]|nr:xanthine dehydrogenase family protein molybdopterin-binding subunit [Thermodesulfobacteriota bacterium]
TGEARYTGDLKLPRMLMGKLLSSPHPHARILNIDFGKALTLPGVKAVATGMDLHGQKYGPFRSRRDETGLARDKVRYIGDPVAAVAATDEETAFEAIELIRVEYEELPAVFDAEEAMQEGAPLIHEEYKRNICSQRHFNFGDVEEGFNSSSHIREDHFFSQGLSHGALEPRSALAHFDTSGRLTLWTGTQSPYNVRQDLSLVLGLPASKIRVIKPFVGGGFGGKGGLSHHEVAASLLAIKTRQPVKISLNREEEISMTRLRHPMSVYVKTGVRNDGVMTAQYVRCFSNGGAYACTSVMVTYNSGLTCLIPYRISNFKYDGYVVYTNRPMSGPMRGHGANQPRFAVESQLDMIAEDIGLDPAELRLRNATQKGNTSVNGLVFNSCELSRAIQEATTASGWKQKRNRKEANRGIGIACSGFVSGARAGSHTASSCFVQVNEEGGVVLSTGSSDIGQGSETTLALIVAEVLGLSPSDVTVISGDTETTPIDPGTFSSRVTFYAGNAAMQAASEVKQLLAEAAAKYMEANAEDIEFRDHKVFVKHAPDKEIAFRKLAELAISAGHGRSIIGKGQWSPQNTQFPDKTTGYGNVSAAYSFAAQVAEVEVDTTTGEAKLKKVTIADDCGQVINILGAEGQAEGSVSMGQGHALMEHILFGDKGQIMNPSFSEYKMPTAADMTEISFLEVGLPDPMGPYGAKEIGEGLLISTVPAITNAIYDAVGVRITELPVRPEKILEGLKRNDAVAKI